MQLKTWQVIIKLNLPQEVLDIIHEHLSDCCGAVRHILVLALLYVGNNSSIEPIKKLIHVENESEAVKKTSILIYNKLICNKNFIDTGTSLYVGEVKNNKAEGEGKLYYKHNGHLIYEGGFKDNEFHGEGIYYDNDGNIKHKGQFANGIFVG